jgi:hypothetical protein
LHFRIRTSIIILTKKNVLSKLNYL